VYKEKNICKLLIFGALLSYSMSVKRHAYRKHSLTGWVDN